LRNSLRQGSRGEPDPRRRSGRCGARQRRQKVLPGRTPSWITGKTAPGVNIKTRFAAGERDRAAVGFETGKNLTVRIQTQQHHQPDAARPVVRQGPLLQTRPFPREPCCIAANPRQPLKGVGSNCVLHNGTRLPPPIGAPTTSSPAFFGTQSEWKSAEQPVAIRCGMGATDAASGRSLDVRTALNRAASGSCAPIRLFPDWQWL
jgi:hypothetical protein